MKIAPGIRALLLAMLFVLTRSAVGAQTLPSPWAGTDIGNLRIPGSSTYSSGTFTITAAEGDIWNTSDQFHFVYRQVTGDVEIVARIASITLDTHRRSQAGVMIRESLTAQSRHVAMVGTPAAGYAFKRRTQTGGSSESTAGPATNPPGWVRLVRAGDQFSAYFSTNGVNWQRVGTDTLSMGDTVYVGFPVTTQNSSSAGATLDSVTVIAASSPNAPPAISITAPSANAQYTAPASITIDATATDPESAMLSVDFYANQTLISRDTTAPYSATFATSTAADYSLTAVAHDADGNSTTSAGVPVTVRSPANQVPAVDLTSPTTGAQFAAGATINLAANASDPENQLTKVEFFRDGTLIGTDATAPYSFSWTNVAAGTYSLTAKAYDNGGGIGTSTAVGVTVGASNAPPSVNLTSPANGASFTAPATINLTAAASDPENQLTKVEFLNGATVVGTDTTTPYSFSWEGVAAGTYSLTARAYDSAGAAATSAAVTVTVGTVTSAPKLVVFTASADHATNVSSYFFEVFASGANPAAATAIASSDLGKPTPAANNDITVDRSALFTALAPGNYVATVTAVGPGGRTQGTGVAFTR
jgi:regulation of enolase protein 1 (concanavalin A-like superfamily)